MRADADDYHALFSSDIDGIIAIGFFTNAQISSLQLLSSSITFLDSSPNELLYDSVVLNFELGIKQALDYLREQGHSRIAFIGPKRLSDEHQHIVLEPRRSFCEHYMREMRLFHSNLVIEDSMRDRRTVENELDMRMNLFQPDDLPNAIVTVNEETAIGVIHALRNLH